jgi:hypothetical protein
VGKLIVLDGHRITLEYSGLSIFVNYNERTKLITDVVSPYPNHQFMVGKDMGQRISTLLTAGWKETERRSWHELYM